MNKQELLNDLKFAVESGDTALEDAIYAKLESLDKQAPPAWAKGDLAKSYAPSAGSNLGVLNSNEIKREQPASPTDILNNLVRGIAYPGNKAMTALNPLATQKDYENIRAQDRWVRENKGAGVGEFVGDVFNYLPSALPQGLPARAVATGLLSSAYTPGNMQERADSFGYGAAAGGIGEKLGNVIGSVIQPVKKTASTYLDELVSKAENIGLKLSADQRTGNRTLQKVANVLDTLPTSSAMRQGFKENQRKAWQKALFEKGGETGVDQATPSAMGAMKDRISGVYKELTDKYDLVVDQKLKDSIDKISKNYLEEIPAEYQTIVLKYFDDFKKPPVGATIKGKTYQNIRSRLDKRAKANSDPIATDALRQLRQAVDDAMGRSIKNPGNKLPGTKGQNINDFDKWRKANNDWMVMRSIEDSINTGPALAEGQVNPNALIRNMKKRSPNSIIYGKGNQELADIARVGQTFIPEKQTGSDTAQKQILTRLLTGDFLAGAGAGLITQDPAKGLAAAALTAVPLLAIPPAATKALQRQGGYLTRGLVDLTKDAIPGLTRQELLNALLRTQAARIPQGPPNE